MEPLTLGRSCHFHGLFLGTSLCDRLGLALVWRRPLLELPGKPVDLLDILCPFAIVRERDAFEHKVDHGVLCADPAVLGIVRHAVRPRHLPLRENTLRMRNLLLGESRVALEWSNVQVHEKGE
jgi:hypothetical protein